MLVTALRVCVCVFVYMKVLMAKGLPNWSVNSKHSLLSYKFLHHFLHIAELQVCVSKASKPNRTFTTTTDTNWCCSSCRHALTRAEHAASSECSRWHLQHTPESDTFYFDKREDLLWRLSLELRTKFLSGKIPENSRMVRRQLTVSDGSSFHKNDTEDDEEQALLGAGVIPAHTTASVTSGFQTDLLLKQIHTGQEELPPQAPACSQVCTGDSWGRFPPVSGQKPGEEHRQKICHKPDHRMVTHHAQHTWSNVQAALLMISG